LIVDNFGVKYIGKDHAEHLIATLSSLYTITTNWSGTLYCGITLAWNYTTRTVDLSMPGYIAKALSKFQHIPSKRRQHSPHAWTPPEYGAKPQFTAPAHTSAPLDPIGLKRLQEVIGTLLYYARANYSTMLVALGTLASAQSLGTKATAQAVIHLLNYCTMHPNAITHLHIHSDASYLSESHAQSRAGGDHFLSSKPSDQAPSPNSIPPPPNGAVHTHCSIMSVVLSSATEAETGAHDPSLGNNTSRTYNMKTLFVPT
jgi:hypothetical protein